MILLRSVEIAVIGAGPAGLAAAIAAAKQGAKVLVLDRNDRLGGQLIKQTHCFFGSEREHAGTRGYRIGALLEEEARGAGVEILTEASVLGHYSDGVLTAEQGEEYLKIRPERLIVATGAAERMLVFPNNDLPGIYGAGAVQTLMNVYGVVPGRRAVMVGAGNIGLIVSYQLLQAGVEVAAVVEALPAIGGYLVHASKIRRAGIPILTSHTIKAAHGRSQLEGVTICALDENWREVPRSEQYIEADVMCLAVGLSPLTELLWQAGCEMRYIAELGGHVPLRDENMETTVKGIYVAGDAGGVEEASSAMITGRIAGLAAAASLGYDEDADLLRQQALDELVALRAGPSGDKIRAGLSKLAG